VGSCVNNKLEFSIA